MTCGRGLSSTPRQKTLAVSAQAGIVILLLFSCLKDMVRPHIMEQNAKIKIFCSYNEKQIKFGNSESFGFPISPCATSLEGEFPKNRKGFLCVMIRCMLNQIIKKTSIS